MRLKRHFFIICLSGLLVMQGRAQTDAPAAGRGSRNQVTLGLSFPFGVFQRSHFGGVGVDYSWTNNRRFGAGAAPKKAIGLIVQGAVDYFLGKKLKTAGYPFRYDNYLVAEVGAGMMYNPWMRTHLALTAGPLLGIYKGFTDWGYSIQLSGAYYINQRFSIGPAMVVRKFSEADALWAGAIKLSYTF